MVSALLTLSGFSALAQNSGKNDVVMVKCVHVGVSRPLSELFINEDNETSNFKEKKESEDRKHRTPYLWKENAPVQYDGAVQTQAGTLEIATLLTNWAGQTGDGYPPDPTGSAGIDYFVQAVNATPFRVYNKTTGSTVGTVKQIGSLWSPATGNLGDPIVLYDKFADRWFLSQFGESATSNYIYIAISTTNNPTGTYYTYTFTSPEFPDYQKFSIWTDGYYMTSNQTQKIFCFQRSVMLTGGTPKSFYKTFSPPQGSSFFCPLPADADGQLPPSGTPCPIFCYEDDGWGSSYTDRINIYSMTVNWTPATPTATIAEQHLPSAAFDASYNSQWNDIPQPGVTQKLDGIGGVFMFRAQHRVWTGYNSVVLCMGVKVSSTQRGMRWYELRQNTSTGVWSIYQQGTYSPSDGLYRWCGSIAMDDNGSIGMAYCVSGGSGTTAVSPTIRYTGRRAVDPLGTMTFAETTVTAGSGTQSGINRFGDYSQTSIDPVDGTIFWHTGEYISGGNTATRIFSFRIPLYVGVDEKDFQNPDFKVYKNENNLFISATSLPSNNSMQLDLFDITGKLISSQVVYPNANAISEKISTNLMAAGTYIVRLGEPNTGFQKVEKIVIE